MIFLYALLPVLGLVVSAEEPALLAVSTSSVLPAYLSLSSNINDFTRFADGGDPANWYIGFNNAWIVKLPPAPVGDFARAFVGAKIGRAKTRPNPNKPWLREVIAGKIYIGISQTPSFNSEQSYFLAETTDIPLEPDPQAPVDGVGASQWFWAEVPMSAISFTRPNYLIAWSPSQYFLRASSSPILAAAGAEAPEPEPRAWNNRSISGVPPRSPDGALETPLNNLHPALAIKLVPVGEYDVVVSELSMVKIGKKAVVQFSVGGDNIAEAWVESSRDQLDWARISSLKRQQPFIFTVSQERLPGPGGYLRAAARDVSGDAGYSPALAIPYGQP